MRISLHYKGFKDMEYFKEEYMQQHGCHPNQPKIQKLKHPNNAAMPSILSITGKLHTHDVPKSTLCRFITFATALA